MKNVRRQRRNRAALELVLEDASNARHRALAHYDLGLFHDNNSREGEAIPHYREAIKLGLTRPIRAKALTWLASSLYKTGDPKGALAHLRAASRLASDQKLRQFIDRLERRINAAI